MVLILFSTNTKARLKLPAYTMFGIFHQVNPQWAVMANAVYTQWDVIKNITLTNLAGLNAQGMPATNLTATSATNYRNTWRLTGGVHYSPNDMWTFRAGFGWDQTPTKQPRPRFTCARCESFDRSNWCALPSVRDGWS